MQWKGGSRTALDIGGSLCNKLFVKKDVKIKVYNKIHDQATNHKVERFPIIVGVQFR
jgi:hypothetical protein